MTENEIIKHSIEHIIDRINGEYAALTKTIFPKEYTYENGKADGNGLWALSLSEN